MNESKKRKRSSSATASRSKSKSKKVPQSRKKKRKNTVPSREPSPNLSDSDSEQEAWTQRKRKRHTQSKRRSPGFDAPPDILYASDGEPDVKEDEEEKKSKPAAPQQPQPAPASRPGPRPAFTVEEPPDPEPSCPSPAVRPEPEILPDEFNGSDNDNDVEAEIRAAEEKADEEAKREVEREETEQWMQWDVRDLLRKLYSFAYGIRKVFKDEPTSRSAHATLMMTQIFKWLTYGDNLSEVLRRREPDKTSDATLELTTKKKRHKRERFRMISLTWMVMCQNMCISDKFASSMAYVKSKWDEAVLQMQPPPTKPRVLAALLHRLRIRLLSGNHFSEVREIKYETSDQTDAAKSREESDVYKREQAERAEAKRRTDPLYVLEVAPRPYLYEHQRTPEERKDPLLEYVYNLSVDDFELVCSYFIASADSKVPGYQDFEETCAWFLHWRWVYDDLRHLYPIKPYTELLGEKFMVLMVSRFREFSDARARYSSNENTGKAFHTFMLELFAPVGVLEFYKTVKRDQKSAALDPFFERYHHLMTWLEPTRTLGTALDASLAMLCDASNVPVKDVLSGKFGESMRQTLMLFQFFEAFRLYLRSDYNFARYFIMPTEVFKRRQELTDIVCCTLPPRQHLPRIVMFDRTILLRQRDLYYETKTPLEACLLWLYIVQRDYDGRIEFDDRKINPLLDKTQFGLTEEEFRESIGKPIPDDERYEYY